MSELSISNVIRVTVSGVERARGVKNVNEVALFTTETPNNSNEYMICIDPSDIVKAYGTDSLTAKMAQAVFAQSPNINSGNGYLAVIPMKDATNATAASFKTAALTVSGFDDVKNGSLKITTGGQVYSLSGLNFTACENINDIAQVISNAVSACFVTVDGSSLVFTAKEVGKDSSIVLSSGEGGTDISAEGMLDIAKGTATAGEDAGGESLENAIDRVKGKVRFTGVLTTKYMDNAVCKNASNYINSLDLIWVNVWYSASDIAGICTTIKEASEQKTRCLVYTGGFEDAKLYAAAYTGRAFSVNFNGSSTSQTMNLKTLAGVSPDTGIDQTAYQAAEDAGVDLYVSYEGDPAVVSNGGNGYFDVVYENMALKFAAQTGLYNALKTTGTKIPQTEAGVAVLTDALGNVFQQFVRNGVIAPGKWNSSQTFGNPEVFRDNIANTGWYVYHTPISLQAQSEREQRIAPMIQGACKRAGAVHSADIMILVEE